jgi:hypothetical protein
MKRTKRKRRLKTGSDEWIMARVKESAVRDVFNNFFDVFKIETNQPQKN